MNSPVKTLRLFTSQKEAEEAELERRRKQTPEERMKEFSLLQERVWGEAWTSKPLVRVMKMRRLPWADKES